MFINPSKILKEKDAISLSKSFKLVNTHSILIKLQKEFIPKMCNQPSDILKLISKSAD